MPSQDLVDASDTSVLVMPLQLSKPVFQTSPTHLRAAAHLYGVDSVPLREARVLELGCGAGGNLLPYALGYPQSVVIGIDIDTEPVSYGQQVISDLGVQNLQLFAVGLDVLLGIEDLGEFDYIVVHGAYALIDADTRLALMNFCRAHLSPLGLACFGYPTYPGQKSHDVLRDAVQLHSGLANSEADRLASAKAMLTFMAHGIDGRNPLATLLRKQAAQAERKSDLAVALEFLEGFGQPCYFVEFNDLAQQAGFVYVGDAEPHTELPGSYPANVRNLYQIINPEGSKVLGQQYLDFASGRASRMSLLAHASRAADISAYPQMERLRDLRWAGSFKRVVDASGAVANGHTDVAQESIGTDDRTALRILDVLGSVWPASLDFDTLTFNVRVPIASLKENDQSPAVVANALAALFTQGRGMLRPSLDAGPYDALITNQLCAVPGLTLLAGPRATDMPYRVAILNLWGDAVDIALEPSERAMLPYFDGKRDLGSQVATLRTLIAPDEASPEERKAANQRARKALSTLIDKLRRHGLLLGSSAAWADYYRQAMAAHMDEPMAAVGYADALMMTTLPPALGGLAASASGVGPQRSAAARPVPALTAALQKVQILVEARKHVEAEQLVRQLVVDFPQSPRAWQKLNQVLLHLGQVAHVLEPALQAVQLDPYTPAYYFDLAAALRRQLKPWYAEYFLEKVLRVQPDDAVAWDHLGCFYERRKAMEDARLCHVRALELDPHNASVMCNLATVYSNQSRVELAMTYYEKAVAQEPSAFHIHSNYLFTSIHANSVDAQKLFERHRAFGRKVEANASLSRWEADFSAIDRNPDRPLRIGFVSADLRTHAVASFIERFWHDMDKEKFAIYAYSNSLIHDDVSERLKRSCSQWRAIAGMEDSQVARLVREDQVDILIDLSGHTANNRLPMFAFRPAPVQMGWIGYPCTTGLEAMDYYIADKNMAEPGALESQFTEALIYMPPSKSFTFDIPVANRMTQAPCLRNGYVTFASLNRPMKINEDVLKIWSTVLTQARDARMLIGCMFDGDMSADISARMQRYGVAPEQLTFRQHMPWAEYLKLHSEIDILLDTFPYTGGTTSANAIGRGIPTITLSAETMVGKQGVAIMKAVGLEEFVAYSPEEYVALAVKWSKSPEALARIRAGYRSGSRGKVTNARPAFYLEAALREAWRRFCLGTDRASFSIEP